MPVRLCAFASLQSRLSFTTQSLPRILEMTLPWELLPGRWPGLRVGVFGADQGLGPQHLVNDYQCPSLYGSASAGSGGIGDS